MKIGVTATDNSGLEAGVDLHFGRAPFFAVVDTETMEVDFIDNSATNASSGAGVTAAQTIVDQGVNALISGNFGPKAFNALKVAKLKLFSFQGGTIKEAIENYKAGKLEELSSPTRSSHSV